MLSDADICEFYKVDEDDMGMIEDIRFLLGVSTFERLDEFDTFEKLEIIQSRFGMMSGKILDGSQTDELCQLFDDTHFAFRNLKAIVAANLKNEQQVAMRSSQLQSTTALTGVVLPIACVVTASSMLMGFPVRLGRESPYLVAA